MPQEYDQAVSLLPTVNFFKSGWCNEFRLCAFFNDDEGFVGNPSIITGADQRFLSELLSIWRVGKYE